MKTLIFCLLTIFTFTNVFCQSKVGDDENIKKYVALIDRQELDLHIVIDSIQKDRSVYAFHGSSYSASDYIVLRLTLGANPINCQRLDFLYMISSKEYLTTSSLPKCMLAYAIDDSKTLQECISAGLNDSIHQSFYRSIQMALDIRKIELNGRFEDFQDLADSLQHEFDEITNNHEDIKSMLPMYELLVLWNEKFPFRMSKKLDKFINRNKWDDFESLYIENFYLNQLHRSSKILRKCSKFQNLFWLNPYVYGELSTEFYDGSMSAENR